MTCTKSKSTNGDHCRHGPSRICCWCGETEHGPFLPSLPLLPNTLLPSGYACATCKQWVFSNAYHFCHNLAYTTICSNPR